MGPHGPIRGLAGWIRHRIIANYWSLPVAAVLSAVVAGLVALELDRDGAAQWLLDRDLSPVATADTGKDWAAVVAGIDTALLTLYFSISLLVLTLAASNLAVRLIDRWLEKPLVRVSLSGLSFSVIYALVVLAAIDSEAELADTPLLALWGLFALQVVNLAMLAVALHDLGRTMFVDRSIAQIGKDAGTPPVPLTGMAEAGDNWAETLRAPRSGYVEGIGLDRLMNELAAHPGRVRFCAAPGQHVMEGEPLVLFERQGAALDRVADCIPIGSYRSNAEGAVFQIRLLVEIAARALSPAINDFYTAIACVDRLGEAMVRQQESWVEDGEVPAFAPAPRFELPGQDFRHLFDDPLKALRQAAADYPSVSIRLVNNYARVCAQAESAPGLCTFLQGHARDLASHAAERAQFAKDREAIERSMDDFGKTSAA